MLENVTEFIEEVDSLKHFVFTNEYFKKKRFPDILSVNRHDTYWNYRVLSFQNGNTQCRGMKNNKSQHHKNNYGTDGKKALSDSVPYQYPENTGMLKAENSLFLRFSTWHVTDTSIHRQLVLYKSILWKDPKNQFWLELQ